jgi:hypothetical protein
VNHYSDGNICVVEKSKAFSVWKTPTNGCHAVEIHSFLIGLAASQFPSIDLIWYPITPLLKNTLLFFSPLLEVFGDLDLIRKDVK